MKRICNFLIPVTAIVLFMGGCSSAGEPAAPAAASSAPASANQSAPPNPNTVPGVPTDDQRVADAIARVDGLAQDLMTKSGTPGMAVAVVHNGETVFAQGYGVREVGEPGKVDKDTTFAVASVSKPIGATVIAKEVGDGTVAWDTPLVESMPDFKLSDPWVTRNVTIADMYAQCSGLPSEVPDRLEDLGYDQEQIINRLQYLPLDEFRTVLHYTNFGITSGALAVAAAAGTDWATLSERDVYGPLGMTNTSSRHSDFEADPDHAPGHALVGENTYEAKFNTSHDAMSPAGGVSSSASDVATWLAMVMRGGPSADGTRIVDSDALTAAVTPQIRLNPVSTDDTRQTFYGYGFEIDEDASGRIRIHHSGGYSQGTGTAVMFVPNLDIGIVVLTNAAANGVAEALTNEFVDMAEFGSVQQDWYSGFHQVLEATLTDPVGSLVGRTPPASPSPAAANPAYVGTYENDFYGPATVTDPGGALTLTLGPDHTKFPLTHWDGQTFTMVPIGENAPDGSISKVTFEQTGTAPASAVTIEHLDLDGMGTFHR